MTFFLEWPLEARFFFIFGCLIAIILPVAGVIRKRNDWRTTRHTLLADLERAERTEMTQVALSEAEEVPFGIQALEEDLEVDGLWNSKTSTPLHTPLPSPTISSQDSNSFRNALAKLSHSRRTSSISSMSRLEISEPPSVKPLRNHGASLVGGDGAASVKVAHATGHIEDGESSATIQIRTSSAPSTTIPFLGNSIQAHVYQSNIQNLETTKSSNSIKTSSRRGRTFIIGGVSNSGEDVANIIETASALRDLEVLDRMEAHRRFHAAESGQLQPRARRAIMSNVSQSVSQDITRKDPEHYHNLRSISWPATNNEVVINMTVPHSRPQKRTSPRVIPFRAFVEMHPPPKACPSAWTEKTQGLLDDKLEAGKRVTSFTITASSHGRSSSSSSSLVTAPEPSAPSDTGSIYSTIERKVNAGFEILPTGALGRPALIKEFGSRNDPLQISETIAKRPTKLQKRDRSQTRSMTSSSDGTVYHKETLHSPISSTVH